MHIKTAWVLFVCLFDAACEFYIQVTTAKTHLGQSTTQYLRILSVGGKEYTTKVTFLMGGSKHDWTDKQYSSSYYYY